VPHRPEIVPAREVTVRIRSASPNASNKAEGETGFTRLGGADLLKMNGFPRGMPDQDRLQSEIVNDP
jgi:hypothetical protein